MLTPPSLSRRQFLVSTGLASGALVGSTGVSLAASGAPAPNPQLTDPHGFPESFLWGSATSSYQLEGAAAIDGRRPSIWDTFSKTPGRVHNGDTGDVSCDHYHRYKEDVQLMADLGVKHYRLSLSWSRVIPEGRGAVNEKGVDFYKRLFDELHQHGIEPAVTLYHWDLPQALQDRYRGWESDEIVGDFTRYAEVMAAKLGDRVPRWFTLNEIFTFVFIGYGVGTEGRHAPGIALHSAREQQQILKRTLLAHGQAVQAIRAHSPRPTQVGLAENYRTLAPITETPEHIEATRKAFALDPVNGGLIMPVLTGQHDPRWIKRMGDAYVPFTDAELRTVSTPIDLLGFNCYQGSYVRAADNELGYTVIETPRAFPRMNISWLTVTPEVIYWGVRLISEVAGATKLPIVISENGCADAAHADANGLVADADRVMFLRNYLNYVQRAVREGYPLVGYFPWSLMDNFEWAEGYDKRFGIVHVDFQTQKRTPKLSYHWFREVIRQRRVV